MGMRLSLQTHMHTETSAHVHARTHACAHMHTHPYARKHVHVHTQGAEAAKACAQQAGLATDFVPVVALASGHGRAPCALLLALLDAVGPPLCGPVLVCFEVSCHGPERCVCC